MHKTLLESNVLRAMVLLVQHIDTHTKAQTDTSTEKYCVCEHGKVISKELQIA